MIEKHRERLRALPDEALELIADRMNLNGSPLVIEALEQRQLGQADVIFALLPDPGARDVVATLCRVVVHEVERPWPRPLPRRHPPAGPYRIVAAARHLRLPVAAGGRLRVRLGMTLDEVVSAGVLTSAVWEAVRGRLVTMERLTDAEYRERLKGRWGGPHNGGS